MEKADTPKKIIKQFAYNESKAIVAVFLFLYCAVIYYIIAGWHGEMAAIKFDTYLISLLGDYQRWDRSIGPAWLVPFLRDITVLGGITTTIVIMLLGSAILYMKNKIRTMITFIVPIIGGAAITYLAKFYFATMGETVNLFDLLSVRSHGFPSGHAIMSVSIYLTIGVLFSRTQRRKAVRVIVMNSAVFLVLLIGASRVLLGAHQPTEIFAGWALGLSWVSLCWLVEWYLSSKIFPYKIPFSKTHEG